MRNDLAKKLYEDTAEAYNAIQILKENDYFIGTGVIEKLEHEMLDCLNSILQDELIELERQDIPGAKYWNNICEMQRRQTQKGIESYGQILEQNTSMTDLERIEYLEEELIDALMYIEHLKERICDGREENNN